MTIDAAYLREQARKAVRMFFAPLCRIVCLFFGHSSDRVLVYSEARKVSVFGCDRCGAAHFRLYDEGDLVATDVLKTAQDIQRYFDGITGRS
jgi:hypothetical protein